VKNTIRVIAFYLPQFHPIPENDLWWGKGFTEWTNVAKAKPLFKGHYQPKIPADLGYYDLRLSEAREAQVQLAKEAGIEGFCYWHYWFEGKRLLDRPFNEVLASGKPDFPFCLCWANHSWFAKTWNKDVSDKLLIEQTYPGKDDYENHFYQLLPAFKDKRYIRVNNKPVFGIFSPFDIPDLEEFIALWNQLAMQNGITGIYFVAISFKDINNSILLRKGINAIIYDLSFYRKSVLSYFYLSLHKIFKIPQIIDYREYTKTLLAKMPIHKNILPCIIPNFDHTPRSGRRGSMMINCSPENWRKLLLGLFTKIRSKSGHDNIVFIKSWNEWAEGNYMEPDLKYGKGYIEALSQTIESLK
jgi:hypothetical protein